MKKLFKSILIVFILSLFALTFIGCNKDDKNNNEQNNPIVNPSDNDKKIHTCHHVCEICGKCLDPNCTDAACSEKCPGHEEEPVEHECHHVCPECGKCLDPNCTDAACSDKCPGHEVEPVEHECHHVCPECGKCLDPNCTDPACSEKCPCYEVEPVEHECHHVCPECGKCLDPNCTDAACSEKCPGHEEEPVEHECHHVCPICGKCTDLECTDPACSEKCPGHEVEPVADFTEEELAQIANVFSKKIPYHQNNSYTVDVIDDYVFITFSLSDADYEAYLDILNKTFNLVYDTEYEYYYYEDGLDCLNVYAYKDDTEDDNLIYLYIYQEEPFDLEISDQDQYTNDDLLILKQYFYDYEKLPFAKCYGYEINEDSDEYGPYSSIYFYTNKENEQAFYNKLNSLFVLEYDDLYESYYYETTTDCFELDIYEYNDDEYEIYLFLYQSDGSLIGGETPIIDTPDDFLDQTTYTASDLALIKENFSGTVPFAKCYDYEVYTDEDEYGAYTVINFITDNTNYNLFFNALKTLYKIEYDEYYDCYLYETETDSFELDIYEEEDYIEIILFLYGNSEITPIEIPDDFLDQNAYTASDLALIKENFGGTIPFAKCYDYEVYTDSDSLGDYTYVYFLTDNTNKEAFYNALIALYDLEYDDYYECYLYETKTDCIELDIYQEEDYTEVILYLYQGEDSGSGDTPAVTDGIEINVETLGSSIGSSYATFEKTFDGITFKFSNIMINPKTSGVSYDDFIQMKNSTKSGLISNTTPFSGLNSLNAIFIVNPSSGNLNTFKVYGGDTLGAKTYQATVVSEVAVTIEGIDGTQIFYEFSNPVKYITIENTGATTFYNLVFGETNASQGSKVDLVDDGNGYKLVDFTKGEVKDVTGLGDYLDGCPTTGNLNVLVIPVEFSDCTAQSKGYTVDMIKKVFNGNEDDTFLYYSVKKYFDLASYGNLNINFDVVDQFIRAKYASTEYEKEYKKGTSTIPEYFDYYGFSSEDDEGCYVTPEMLILDECLQYLDKELNYDLSKYDSDNNETIDAVILIYTADIDDVSDEAFYWAFRAWNLLGNPLELYDPEDPANGYDWYRYDGVYANDYLWASYQFIFESSDGETFDSYNTVNTYTFIHEFSHVLGADDYYDYSYNTEPMDGYDMMDMSSGDHNLFTKSYFGWIKNARLITTEENVTLTLNSMENSGDVIILANSFDESKGLFQEYYLIEYYTNDGLNTKNGELFENDGIVIYHVSANATYDEEYEAYYLDNNNTSYSRDTEWGTKYNLITLISSNGNYVFGVNDTIPTLKFDNGATLGFTFTIDELTDDAATISFQRK